MSYGHHGTDVLIVGCGIIGAAVAWRLAERGLTVRCLDPDPGRGATHAAAGMLAAVTESTFGEQELMRLDLTSATMWPAFAAELTELTGVSVGLRETGTVTVAYAPDDRRQLRRLLALQRSWGLEAEEIDVAAARELEPALGPRIAGAGWAPGDHQVDPRASHTALMRALSTHGVDVVRRRATRLCGPGLDAAVSDGRRPRNSSGAAEARVTGVIDDVGETHAAGTVVIAAGWASRALLPQEPGLTPAAPTRPVKGEVLRLSPGTPSAVAPARIVRGIVQSRPIYLVPRDGGEIVVGATSEERPDDRHVTAGGVFALLRDARAVVPGIDELAISDITARARPGTPDNLPLIGPTGLPGLALATGHYRNGILLAPLTAAALTEYCTDGTTPPTVTAADPRRFSPHREGAPR